MRINCDKWEAISRNFYVLLVFGLNYTYSLLSITVGVHMSYLANQSFSCFVNTLSDSDSFLTTIR